MNSSRSRGFSLLELMIVVLIGFTIAAISVVALMPLYNRGHIDSAYDTTLGAMRNARHLAITQSHQYYVNFIPAVAPTPAQIQITYQPPAAAVGAALPPVQNVMTYSLPPDVNFSVMAGVPVTAPDSFGTGLVPVDFGQGLGAGSLNFVSFLPDGSSQDNVGNYNSGILYMVRTGDTIYGSRAITVWGATGRIRGWRLYNVSGANTWVQQ
jgi:type II secretory pathway pseudopilin PulG